MQSKIDAIRTSLNVMSIQATNLIDAIEEARSAMYEIEELLKTTMQPDKEYNLQQEQNHEK